MGIIAQRGALASSSKRSTPHHGRRYVIFEPAGPHHLSDSGHQQAFNRYLVPRATAGELEPYEVGPLEQTYYHTVFLDERRRWVRIVNPFDAPILIPSLDRTRDYFEWDVVPDRLYECFLNEPGLPFHRYWYRVRYGAMPTTLRPRIGLPLGAGGTWSVMDDLLLGLPDHTILSHYMDMQSEVKNKPSLMPPEAFVARLTREGQLASEWPFWLAQLAHNGSAGILARAEYNLKIDAPDLQQLFIRTPFAKRINRPIPVTYCLSWLGFLWHELTLNLRDGRRGRTCKNPLCHRTFITVDPRQQYCKHPACMTQRNAQRQRQRRTRG